MPRAQPVPQLNELECVDGAVYANVYQTDEIVRREVFGPVVTVTRFSDVDEAIALAKRRVIDGAPKEFDIPAGALAAALDAYTQQSGEQLIYSSDRVRGARSAGVVW